jgi:hypothetical protein
MSLDINDDTIEPLQTGPMNDDLVLDTNPIDERDVYNDDVSESIIEMVTKTELLSKNEKEKFIF